MFLHVGAPKTGTSYLQSTLAANRTQLAARGLSYPQTHSGSHFEAAIDLLDLRWGGALKSARGEWDRLAASALQAPGDVVISHELLAAATPEQVARARRSLDDAEVHLVYTARDLGRQIPAEWQEGVKHRVRKPFRRFLREVVDAKRVDSDLWFWRVQHLPDVLTRWGNGLPVEHVHVVTVPPPGADRDLLWGRYAGVLGIDPAMPLEPGEVENSSLGVVEAAVLRKLNVRLRGRHVPQPVYAAVVRDLIARDVLSPRSGQVRIVVPPKLHEFVDEVAGEWVDFVEGGGVDLVGNVADLRTTWPSGEETWRNPDAARPVRELDATLDALAAVIEREGERFRNEGVIAPKARGLRRRLGL